MAPNQQSLAQITQSLSNLDLRKFVKSEFVPLTDPKAAAHQQTPSPTDVKPSKPASSSDDYWAWTPSVETAEIEETLSISHIEEQLLRDAQNRSQKVETVRAPTTTNVDYWDEATETDTLTDSVPSKAQHEESFWEWKSDAKDVFASECIVENLKSQSEYREQKQTKTVKSGSASIANYWDESTDSTIRATRTHASYWEWESDAKQELIDSILRQIEACKLTSASHIEKTLRQAASDAYWSEFPVETASDAYWNWESTNPSQVASTGAVESYWDW
mmetsp:Transcript_16199/g.29274  ORF Transcript_16199/g.29274 Transcript_16199/m.29274 type:complete len:275 (+) Transcript_16199:52-876(+)|eukprot:CAMPEP_0202494200 /NCGR_PEP_ID=MMETSP1361-20130828/11015_1 /ASSEMBLY_ACC=CAM_ASM_000849 /TAXON_ID=210615 /ORGANISM="Staurosira complex sp., Strain CCMP2646" /LENGTH=274 /DNA_ID=CAMNT_0049124627 /DNA_START=24 /DNA_END=845 /DNA_ORIENTATION=+